MIFKTYQNYIIKFYLSMLFQVSLVFFGLILILNIFEEMNYIKDLDVNLFYPLLLTTLNSPSILYLSTEQTKRKSQTDGGCLDDGFGDIVVEREIQTQPTQTVEEIQQVIEEDLSQVFENQSDYDYGGS